ncbi:MAG: type IV secretory system conjugative DNA transfer family protein, partial [Chloroflexota bacterium]|nr:type IV secretory system conjugative DNA transfer family protein [Chloroflexota bacterium]
APKSTFNLREVIDSGKILLVKLDKGRLKDAADLLGSLILSKLQLAVFSRSDTPAPLRRNFYLYVDEFQNFAGDNFAVFLSEARKYGLSLVLAHQTLAQIPTELQSLILGNAGIQVVFRVNRRDAERVAKEFFSYSGYEVKHATISRITTWSLGEEWEHYTEELQNQPPRFAHVKHKIQGGLIPIQTADVEPAAQTLGLSSIQFGQYLATLPIGANYVMSRSQLERSALATPSVMASENGTDDLRQRPEPDLSEDELAFLELVVAEPEQTISALYKTYGASVWKGQKLRATLIAAGYLIEIETRLGKRGRLAKYLIPSSKATEFFPAPLPEGRGGPVHRHLQRFVMAEATSKGYVAQTEYELPNGGIVDVHIDRGADQVAVEIAMTSTATRELEHIAACLAAGYGEIVSLVVSETTRTALERDLPHSFDETECQRVRVVPVAQVGSIL